MAEDKKKKKKKMSLTEKYAAKAKKKKTTAKDQIGSGMAKKATKQIQDRKSRLDAAIKKSGG